MLPAANRMRRAADFSAAVRHGRRAGRHTLVLHQVGTGQAGEPLIGLVVSRAVGGSVVRHRVSRRLRAQLGLRLDAFPTGSRTVVRALPAAARAESAELGADLDGALARIGAAR